MVKSMAAPESLKSIVSAILQVPADTIGADFPLRTGRLKTSIGGGILDAAIRRRLGVTTEAAYTATTYAELGGLASARSLLESALRDKQDSGALDPHWIEHNLAAVLGRLRDLEGSRALLESVLEARERS